jgi:hypothetical protein
LPLSSKVDLPTAAAGTGLVPMMSVPVHVNPHVPPTFAREQVHSSLSLLSFATAARLITIMARKNIVRTMLRFIDVLLFYLDLLPFL